MTLKFVLLKDKPSKAQTFSVPPQIPKILVSAMPSVMAAMRFGEF